MRTAELTGLGWCAVNAALSLHAQAEAFNSERLIELVGALIRDADKKVFLILQNLRVLRQTPERVKTYFGDPKLAYAAA